MPGKGVLGGPGRACYRPVSKKIPRPPAYPHPPTNLYQRAKSLAGEGVWRGDLEGVGYMSAIGTLSWGCYLIVMKSIISLMATCEDTNIFSLLCEEALRRGLVQMP